MAKKVAKKAPKKAAKKTVPKGSLGIKKAAKKIVKKAVKKQAAKKPAPKKAAKSTPVKAEPTTASVNPYLIFNGDCDAAFQLYKSVFGGKFTTYSKFKDMPPSEEHQMSAAAGDMIMHVSLPISKETTLMGSDSGENKEHAVTVGNNISISVNATSKNQADKFFNKLSEGGKATMPMANTFWGSYFGMLTDKFGINWMVSFDQPQNKK